MATDNFEPHGIPPRLASRNRRGSGNVELLDDAKLLKELRSLERRRGPSGRDRVDHRRGEHDDRANAVAGVVSLLATVVPRKGRAGFGWITPEEREERRLRQAGEITDHERAEIGAMVWHFGSAWARRLL